MRARNFASASLLLVPLMACGGSGKSGGSPTSPGATMTSLSIAPATELLKLKATENFTATATLSNGSSTVVTPAWRSDNAAVLTIESGGRATAVASGTATIIAEHQGLSVTRLLRVVPDYQGSWRGDISMRSCEDEGDWEGACEELSTGDRDTISIAATQQGAAVSATLDLGGFAGPVVGTIATDGTLSLSGTYSSTMDGFPFQISVVEWQSASTDNSRMTGHASFTMRTTALNGQARLNVDLIGVNKTGPTLAAQPPVPGGELGRLLHRALLRR
jgi:hypothetical protein